MKSLSFLSILLVLFLPAVAHADPTAEQFEGIAELVEAGKHREALGQVQAFLSIWPENEDLQSLERMLTNAIAGQEQRAAPPRQERKPTPSISPADQLEIETVVGGVRNAMNVRDTERRQRDLRAILNRRIPANADTPPWLPYWQVRAVAALQLDDLEVGWRAGQQLKALDAIRSNDPALRQVMAELNLKGWLEDELPGPVRGRDYSVDLGGGVNMEFVWIPALNAWVGKYEVTNGEFRRFRGGHDSGYSQNEDRQPVVHVSFNDAVAFAEWLSGYEGLQNAGVRARLLTGYEWTTIARCGTNRRYPWGDSMPPTRGNYSDKIDGYSSGRYVRTVKVEESGRNEWGLYGVGGNVREWTSEVSGTQRVLRGASYIAADHAQLRVDNRGTPRTADPTSRGGVSGFRVLLSRGGG